MTTAKERPDLLRELGLDKQNHAALGRVLGTGSIAEATERADGTMEATIRIKEDELCWDPAILVMPHGGVIELDGHQRRQEHARGVVSEQWRQEIPLAAEPLEGQGETAPRRPRLLLVQLAQAATTKAGD